MGVGDLILDAIDVLVVAWLFTQLFLVFQQTKAIRVLMGLGVLLIVYLLARALNFEALLGLVGSLTGRGTDIAIVLLVFIFADEIKDTFSGIVWNLTESQTRSPSERVVEAVSRACSSMAATKTGALIAIARENPLDHWEEADSVKVNAHLSAQLLETIFSGKTPLHDGAVIIRGGRLVAAKCQLPQSKSPEITKRSVGMRHRAAFGLSEMSDAVVVVVSEERGWISISHKGKYYPAIAPEDLTDRLRGFLDVETRPVPWYHHSRLFAHGWLKLLAFALAFALWAEQETTFTLRDKVHVTDPIPEDRDARLRPRELTLTQGDVVVTNGDLNLRPLRRDGDLNYYEQVFPEMSYQLRGKNRARLQLLLRSFNSWLQYGEVPAELAGAVSVALPGEAEVKRAIRESESLACEMRIANSNFALVGGKLNLTVDTLATLDRLTVAFEGEPAPGYTMRSESPLQISLGGRSLTVPSRDKQELVRSGRLDPCTTISIDGLKSFDAVVSLDVPEVVRRWNPDKRDFRTRMVLVFWSEELERDVQAQLFTEAAQRDIEALRNEARRRAQEAKEAWLTFERRLKDETWDQGLTYSSYSTLVERTLPDLERRIEKARVDLDAARALYRTQEQAAKAAQTPEERERARAGMAICEIVRGWRAEILESLESEQENLRRRAEKMTSSLKPLLTALAEAQALKEAATKEVAPTLPTSRSLPLQALVESKGPTASAQEAPSEVIAKAGFAKDKRLLFQLIVKVFERWYLALSEFETLSQTIRDLDVQINNSKAPIHLELKKAEKIVQRETRELLRARQEDTWRRIQPLLKQAMADFDEETRLLSLLATSWAEAEVQRLDPRPFVLLFRDFELELPQVLAARTMFSETLADARGDPTADLRREAKEASRAWWGYQRRIAERIEAISSILNRRANMELVITLPLELGALRDRAELESRARFERDTPGIVGRVRLGDLARLKAELSAVTASITSVTAAQEVRKPRVRALEQELNKGPTNGAMVEASAGFSRLRTELHEIDESLLLLRLRSKHLQSQIASVEPTVLPLIKSRESRIDELEKRYSGLIEERIPELVSVRKDLTPWLEMPPKLAKLDERISGIADVTSADPTFSDTVEAAFQPRVDDALGFQAVARLERRMARELSDVQALEEDLVELEALPEVKKSAETDVEVAVKSRRLTLQRTDIDVLRERLREARTWLALAPQRKRARELLDAVTPAALKALSRADLEKIERALDSQLEARRARSAQFAREAAAKAGEENEVLLRASGLIDEHLIHLESMRASLRELLARLPKPPGDEP